jgi:formylglycine-generating enzyme required for sulfatase activity
MRPLCFVPLIALVAVVSFLGLRVPSGTAAPVPASLKDPVPGQERSFEIAEKVPMVFCWVPKGRATLGSPNKEGNRKADEPERVYEEEVGFWLSKNETTQEQWEAVMGYNPSLFAKTGADKQYRKLAEGVDTTKYPVENVSWGMICGVKGVGGGDTFLGRLNDRPDIAKTFGARAKFALPNEDRWEYAARGGQGNANPFYWGKTLNGTEANCDGRSPYGGAAKGNYVMRPQPVGSYVEKEVRHPWGLCDIVGNVWEWCENEYSDGRRVLRGGSWRYGAEDCRVAHRWGENPSAQRVVIGFRVCVRLD